MDPSSLPRSRDRAPEEMSWLCPYIYKFCFLSSSLSLALAALGSFLFPL